MKIPAKFRIGLLTLALAGIFSCPSAHAQLLMDQTLSNMSGAASELGSVKGTAPDSVILGNLQRQGYTNIGALKPASPGGPISTTATAPNGSHVKLSVDPLTGQLLGATPY